MNKHTPGPWNISITHQGLEVRPFQIATEADARLITASPDLYSAARDAVTVMPTGPEKDALIECLLGLENDK